MRIAIMSCQQDTSLSNRLTTKSARNIRGLSYVVMYESGARNVKLANDEKLYMSKQNARQITYLLSGGSNEYQLT